MLSVRIRMLVFVSSENVRSVRSMAFSSRQLMDSAASSVDQRPCTDWLRYTPPPSEVAGVDVYDVGGCLSQERSTVPFAEALQPPFELLKTVWRKSYGKVPILVRFHRGIFEVHQRLGAKIGRKYSYHCCLDPHSETVNHPGCLTGICQNGLYGSP